MEKVVILGCGGSGKSTLARRLGELTGQPVVHLDRLFWQENWTESTQLKFDTRLNCELQKPGWIMDGNYSRTIPQRLEACDTVIYLDYSRWVCLWGAVRRVIRYYGHTRPDMGENCPERFHWEFVRWIWNFNQNTGDKTLAQLSQLQGKTVFILKNRRQTQVFLENCTQNTHPS